jgi:hypothetical protein
VVPALNPPVPAPSHLTFPSFAGAAALAQAVAAQAPDVLLSEPFQVQQPCRATLQLLVPVCPCSAATPEQDLADAQRYFQVGRQGGGGEAAPRHLPGCLPA